MFVAHSFHCQSLETASLCFLQACCWDRISTTFQSTQARSVSSTEWNGTICLQLVYVWGCCCCCWWCKGGGGGGALPLWLQCHFIITPWPAASSLLRHFIEDVEIQSQGHSTYRSSRSRRWTEAAAKHSGVVRVAAVGALKTVWSLSVKQFLIFSRLSLCESASARYIIGFFLPVNNDELLNTSTLHKHICTQTGGRKQ